MRALSAAVRARARARTGIIAAATAAFAMTAEMVIRTLVQQM